MPASSAESFALASVLHFAGLRCSALPHVHEELAAGVSVVQICECWLHSHKCDLFFLLTILTKIMEKVMIRLWDHLGHNINYYLADKIFA